MGEEKDKKVSSKGIVYNANGTQIQTNISEMIILLLLFFILFEC